MYIINIKYYEIDDTKIFKENINDSINDFMEKNKDLDFDNTDIIIKKVGGKYVTMIDKKREEKIKEIFKDDEK